MSCVYQAETGIFSHSPCEQYGTIPEHDMSGPLIVGIFGQLVAILLVCRLPPCYPANPASLLFGPPSLPAKFDSSNKYKLFEYYVSFLSVKLRTLCAGLRMRRQSLHISA